VLASGTVSSVQSSVKVWVSVDEDVAPQAHCPVYYLLLCDVDPAGLQKGVRKRGRDHFAARLSGDRTGGKIFTTLQDIFLFFVQKNILS